MRGRAVPALLAALVLAGCGGEERDPVDAYVDRVNAAQATLSGEKRRADEALKRFAEGELEGRDAEIELVAAEGTIAELRRRVAAVPAPPRAATLRDRILRVFDLNQDLAAETRRLARYVPRAQRRLARLDGIRERLRRGLRRESPGAQEEALRRYAADIDALVAGLGRLSAPPPVLAATVNAQVGRLLRARDLARGLQGAIARQDAKDVARRVKAFREVGEEAPDDGLVRKAVKAYQERLAEVGRAAADVQRERSRLVRRD